MIVSVPACTAPWTVFNPTPPHPTNDGARSGLNLGGVDRCSDSGHDSTTDKRSRFERDIGTTAYPAKDETPVKCLISVPFLCRRLVPSSRKPVMISISCGLTQLGPAGHTIAAASAGRSPGKDDMIARLNGGDIVY